MVIKRNRMSPERRKRLILLLAVRACNQKYGYRDLTREALAERGDFSPSLVNHYFGSLDTLKRGVLRYAVEHKRLHVLGQIVFFEPVATANIPEDLRSEAVSLFHELYV